MPADPRRSAHCGGCSSRVRPDWRSERCAEPEVLRICSAAVKVLIPCLFPEELGRTSPEGSLGPWPKLWRVSGLSSLQRGVSCSASTRSPGSVLVPCLPVTSRQKGVTALTPGYVEQVERRHGFPGIFSPLTLAGSDWEMVGRCSLMAAWASHFKASFCHANKTLWVSVSVLVLLAALTSFLTGLSLQRPADAAPVGTGDSWTSLQQLLWPYTGLQHHGPPPV
ncbi:uncharacterized protein LOC130248574 isoform X2 [Oenanthe melanoleuca]|uniref:uncharacterized protein LOC130248574 isoform X2 n=1 Tax=Oenanthe melanoleuca TaxID=2939378 RepID=UPI0024C17E3A|nr:uncharacterized protein LOC130248574 isoform X2 [Oenanthe melanoleuca]